MVGIESSNVSMFEICENQPRITYIFQLSMLPINTINKSHEIDAYTASRKAFPIFWSVSEREMNSLHVSKGDCWSVW